MRGGLVGSRTLLCPGGAGALRPPGLAVTEKHCVQLPLLVPSWSCTSSCSRARGPLRAALTSPGAGARRVAGTHVWAGIWLSIPEGGKAGRVLSLAACSREFPLP